MSLKLPSRPILTTGLVLLLPLLLAGAASPAAPAGGVAQHGQAAAAAAPGALTLETIMADPDWIGNAPEEGYWADDGSAVYYEAKRPGSELRDLYRVQLAGGAPQRVADADLPAADAPGGELSRDRKWKLYLRDNNVFLKSLESGAVRQLTRTAYPKSDAHFMTGDRRVSFHTRDNSVLVYDLETGTLSQAADLQLTKDPHVEEPADFLKREQLDLFSAVREEREHKKEARDREEALQRSDPTRPPLPFYLGEKVRITGVSLSPSGDYLLVSTRAKDGKESKHATVPHWVDESGYVEPKEARQLVGTEDGCGDSLMLLDLRNHRRHDLDLGVLPGIKDDPLHELREAAIARAKARAAAGAKEPDAAKDKEPEVKADAKVDAKAAARTVPCGGGPATAGGPPAAPSVRPVTVRGAEWSLDGKQAAIELVATDHKDRWIATVDFAAARLAPRHRLNDAAWINWQGAAMGWLADGRTLFFDSEESGWNQLYALDAGDGKIRPLTSGHFEVSSPRPSFDGRTLYYRANADQPGQYDIWRVDVASGKAAALSHLGGLTTFQLSLDERRLLLTHSSLARHDDLYVQDNQPGAPARQVTDTVSAAYTAQHWTIPEIVAIPSTHGAGAPIYSRLYTPAADAPAPGGAGRPAVVFIHGAGYLQDAHAGWSYYFHEFMFHTFLNQHGFVVLDMDYRASAGYGRAWRTAIYRQMGHPELEDLADGVDWLVRNKGVDRHRIGVYGGSYGGFLTLMALFRAPGLFAAGAALRPVTDWSDYNDPYTGSILNTPEIDQEAYDRSSPIEFAGGLEKPLLICHGMVDDNVFFVDSVRLVQKLIELGKQDFSIAPFPVESHSFVRPSSWLDEYRRIWKLMAANLR